jgi:hypothetical protein
MTTKITYQDKKFAGQDMKRVAHKCVMTEQNLLCKFVECKTLLFQTVGDGK